jgi:hypothetical protein
MAPAVVAPGFGLVLFITLPFGILTGLKIKENEAGIFISFGGLCSQIALVVLHHPGVTAGAEPFPTHMICHLTFLEVQDFKTGRTPPPRLALRHRPHIGWGSIIIIAFPPVHVAIV